MDKDKQVILKKTRIFFFLKDFCKITSLNKRSIFKMQNIIDSICNWQHQNNQVLTHFGNYDTS